jgi:hypothetical protein
MANIKHRLQKLERKTMPDNEYISQLALLGLERVDYSNLTASPLTHEQWLDLLD